METPKGFERDPSEGEPWEPTKLDDTRGIKKGDHIRIIGGQKPHEGTVEGFSRKFGVKQVRVRMDEAPNEVLTFELGLDMEII